MPTRPNIILILADDMGYGDFGCFNYGASRTPTLDHLVSEGVCLTQHYSASPVCAPARASLMTGRYPHRTGVIDTLETRGLDRLALRELTVAELLKRAGYTTGLIGKWHNGAYDPRYHPNRRGFDEFAGFSGGWQPYYQWNLDRNGSSSRSDGRYLTDVFTDEATDFIRRHPHRSIFSAPGVQRTALSLRSTARLDAAPYKASGNFTPAVSQIYAMLECMDRGIARVLDELDQHGLTDNTLVMFSSDNGPQFGGKGEMCTDRFNCGFSGAKTLVYEGGIRLPMVLRWPAGLDGRRQVHDMIHFTDWLPTLLALAGIEPPRDLKLDGINVMPTLQGDRGKVPTERFWQWNRYTPDAECNAAMRDGRWKLVRPAIRELMQVSNDDLAMDIQSKYNPENFHDISHAPETERIKAVPPPAQLFDIVNDPFERNDLSVQDPTRVSSMTNSLTRWFEDVEQDRLTIHD